MQYRAELLIGDRSLQFVQLKAGFLLPAPALPKGSRGCCAEAGVLWECRKVLNLEHYSPELSDAEMPAWHSVRCKALDDGRTYLAGSARI